MTILREPYLTYQSVRPPVPTGREALAHVHSGDVLTRSLPSFLRIGAVLWFLAYSAAWLGLWQVVYREYERWELLQAFFAQVIAILTAYVVVRVTLLRARHVNVLPGDDFIFLRALALLCRWLGEVALILAVGLSLSAALTPVSLSLLYLSSTGATPTTFLGFGLLLVSVFALIAAFFVFLLMYTVATTIDLMLAIEFNTRAERVANARELLQSERR
ncbi:MAG TPA: hypothetical protein VNW71_21705 [Thermoanaerobaculia bacterium]|nr:hypothetical protein [Thermoanaerobaculia bacterium]